MSKPERNPKTGRFLRNNQCARRHGAIHLGLPHLAPMRIRVDTQGKKILCHFPHFMHKKSWMKELNYSTSLTFNFNFYIVRDIFEEGIHG